MGLRRRRGIGSVNFSLPHVKKKKKKNPEILCFVLNWLKLMCWIINCGFFFFLTLNNKINNKNKRQNELIYIYIYIY